MRTHESRARRSTIALGLVVGVAGAGALAAVAAATLERASWVTGAYALVALGLLGAYVALAYVPDRSDLLREREQSEARERSERAFLASLEELRKGDLERTLAAVRELPTEFAARFSDAARSLGGLVQQIQNSSIEVAGAGNCVQATSAELASGSSEQAAAVVEITATMEELARTAAQIAGNAASQAELAAQSEESGNAGVIAVTEAVGGVEEVQKRISVIATRTDTLGTRSKEIYRVLDLITEIAQETHILSLNAAIEAAAAGEHGRRFSVVAEEVRRLAQRSQESADSVRTLLDEFAGSIRATIVATEEGSKEAARVLERARAAADAIADLRGALADTARAAREISLATQQQRTASDQVVLTLKEVSQVIQRMAEGLTQFTGTAERLNQLALSIQLLTQSFHLDSPRSLKHLAGQWAGEVAVAAGHWEAVGTRLDQAVRENSFVENAFMADIGGRLVAIAVNPDALGDRPVPPGVAIGADLADRPWFQAVSRDSTTILTPLYDSMLTGERCFTVATPVRSGSGELLGVLGFDVNARNWTRI